MCDWRVPHHVFGALRCICAIVAPKVQTQLLVRTNPSIPFGVLNDTQLSYRLLFVDLKLKHGPRLTIRGGTAAPRCRDRQTQQRELTRKRTRRRSASCSWVGVFVAAIRLRTLLPQHLSRFHNFLRGGSPIPPSLLLYFPRTYSHHTCRIIMFCVGSLFRALWLSTAESKP